MGFEVPLYDPCHKRYPRARLTQREPVICGGGGGAGRGIHDVSSILFGDTMVPNIE